MNTKILRTIFALNLFILAMLVMPFDSNGQHINISPPCAWYIEDSRIYHHDSLEWMVLDSDLIIRGEVTQISSRHDSIFQMHVDKVLKGSYEKADIAFLVPKVDSETMSLGGKIVFLKEDNINKRESAFNFRLRVYEAACYERSIIGYPGLQEVISVSSGVEKFFEYLSDKNKISDVIRTITLEQENMQLPQRPLIIKNVSGLQRLVVPNYPEIRIKAETLCGLEPDSRYLDCRDKMDLK